MLSQNSADTGGQGDARQGEGSGYFIKCRIINSLIWDGEGRWTGTGTGTLHKMLVL